MGGLGADGVHRKMALVPSPMIPCDLPLVPCQLGPQALLLLRGELTGQRSQRLYEKTSLKVTKP